LSEYKNIVKQTGGDIFTLTFVFVIGVFSLLIAYSGIKNVPIRSYFTRKIVTVLSIIVLSCFAGGALLTYLR
jgi:hypothetical protein